MKLSIISKSVSAFVATICLVSGSLAAESSDSCYKKVKKQLHSANKKLDRIKQLEHRLSQEAPTPITQKMMHEADGNLVLTHSGDYCLTENICGTIVIEANSVCLDLCCHTLNAKGQPNAIVAKGFQGLKIFDGRIINASVAAISIDAYSAVELFKLIMNNNALDAIDITNSSDLNVHDVDFINDNSGERALLLDTCNNISITHCNATGFLSTIGAIIQLDTCNAVAMQDVDVSNNTKSPVVNNGTNAQFCFVSADTCTGVNFDHVKVNNNINNSDVTFGYTAIGLFSSPNGSMYRCETSNNTNTASGLESGDAIVLIAGSDNFIVTEHQANNNSCTQIYAQMLAYDVASNNVVFDGCQANSNSMAELVVNTVDSFFAGFYIDQSNDAVIRNCQANFNNVALGGAGRVIATGSGLVGIWLPLTTEVIVDHCQANNNSIGDSQPFTSCIGILPSGATDTIISNSSFDGNTGAEQAIGVAIHQVFTPIVGLNVTVVNCSMSSNGLYGVSVGRLKDLTEAGGDVSIIDCVCNGNGGQAGDTAGIIVQPLTGGTTNLLIKGCQIYDTFSNNDDATGINIANATNVVVEDTNIFNTTAGGTGHGILFDTVTASKIIRTQVHGNQNSGVELVGVNSNVLILDSIAVDNDIGFRVADGSTLIEGVIQGNRAIGNISVGFDHEAVLPVPFDTGYQNNYAQNNGPAGTTNYSISSPIQIFTYDIPTATYVLVPNGASNYPTQANIDAS